jgi:hypothetical protein
MLATSTEIDSSCPKPTIYADTPRLVRRPAPLEDPIDEEVQDDTPVPKPTAFRSYKSKALSSACSCLGFTATTTVVTTSIPDPTCVRPSPA